MTCERVCLAHDVCFDDPSPGCLARALDGVEQKRAVGCPLNPPSCCFDESYLGTRQQKSECKACVGEKL